MTTAHIPILVAPIVEALLEPLKKLPADSDPHYLVDCTLGGGGHTQALLSAMAADPALKKHRVLAIDQDLKVLEKAKMRFAEDLREGRLELFHGRFGEAQDILSEKPILGLMADLGFSSDQLEDASRGLSFQWDGPLDMRLDPTRGQSVRELLRKINEWDLEKILIEYGEERFAKRIAASIIKHRLDKNPIDTTHQLRDIIYFAVPPPARHQKIHAATRSFQALRIAINDELKELESLLSHVILSVKPGGRVAILSFHSLEDRRVKQTFKDKDSIFKPLTKKPIEADEAEIKLNPRSRSAKLRIAERVARGIQDEAKEF